jgi:hypothetical protein
MLLALSTFPLSEAMSRDFAGVRMYRRVHLPGDPSVVSEFRFEYVHVQDMSEATEYDVVNNYLSYLLGLLFQNFNETLVVLTVGLYLVMILAEKVLLGTIFGVVLPVLPWFIGHAFGGRKLTVVF